MSNITDKSRSEARTVVEHFSLTYQHRISKTGSAPYFVIVQTAKCTYNHFRVCGFSSDRLFLITCAKYQHRTHTVLKLLPSW